MKDQNFSNKIFEFSQTKILKNVYLGHMVIVHYVHARASFKDWSPWQNLHPHKFLASV